MYNLLLQPPVAFYNQPVQPATTMQDLLLRNVERNPSWHSTWLIDWIVMFAHCFDGWFLWRVNCLAWVICYHVYDILLLLVCECVCSSWFVSTVFVRFACFVCARLPRLPCCWEREREVRSWICSRTTSSRSSTARRLHTFLCQYVTSGRL